MWIKLSYYLLYQYKCTGGKIINVYTKVNNKVSWVCTKHFAIKIFHTIQLLTCLCLAELKSVEIQLKFSYVTAVKFENILDLNLGLLMVSFQNTVNNSYLVIAVRSLTPSCITQYYMCNLYLSQINISSSAGTCMPD